MSNYRSDMSKPNSQGKNHPDTRQISDLAKTLLSTMSAGEVIRASMDGSLEQMLNC